MLRGWDTRPASQWTLRSIRCSGIGGKPDPVGSAYSPALISGNAYELTEDNFGYRR